MEAPDRPKLRRSTLGFAAPYAGMDAAQLEHVFREDNFE